MLKNKTILILGNGPGLSKLDPSILNNPDIYSIGTNMSCIYCASDLYMSGHPVHWLTQAFHLTNRLNLKKNIIYQGPYQNLNDEFCKLSHIITNRSIVSSNLSKPLLENTKFSGGENIVFAATHLAYILGAKKIIYVGVDCKTTKHFYSYNPFLYQILLFFDSIMSIIKTYEGYEVFRKDIEEFIDCNLKEKGWGGHKTLYLENPQHYNKTMSNYYNQLKNDNIEVFCTDEGLCTEVGIEKLGDINDI